MRRADLDAAGLRADVRAPIGFRHGRSSGKFQLAHFTPLCLPCRGFAKCTVRNLCRPVAGYDAIGDEAMDRRVRPVGCARDVAVLDRVDMDVVDVVGEVALIADGVFPVTALPETPFAGAQAIRARQGGAWHGAGKP